MDVIKDGEEVRSPAMERASKGGRALAGQRTAEERSEAARQAAEARWGTTLPRATHSGELVIAETRIACAVLENRKRVLTQETFLTAIGQAPKAKAGTGSTQLVDGMPPFLAANNLNRFISDELRQSTTPIVFRTAIGGRRAFGYDAMLLPMVCETYLSLRDSGEALPAQQHIIRACDLLMRGLARVGIIALVDEATGYQEERAKDELCKILEAYISEELRPWIPMFGNEFFRQIYRLHGWEFKPGTAKRTPYVGKLINKYIYDQLPPGVHEKLREKNPVTESGYRRYKHHQFLTADTGNVHLDKQISAVTLLMRISDNNKQFEENFERAFSPQKRLPLIIDVE